MKKVVIAAVAILAGATAAVGWLRPRTGGTSGAGEAVVRITARRFEFQPSEIVLKKGVPTTLEITSLDRDHGFKVPALGVRADIKPGATTRVRLVPDRTGRFAFRCDVFCGSGHEDMEGEIVVVE